VANLNKVMLIGRLTRDAEVKTFANGGKVAKFGFACNNRKKDQQSGQWVDDPVFLDVEVFNRGENGKMADTVEQYLGDGQGKGRQLYIEGHLKMDQWEDKQSGQKRSRLLVVVDSFQFLDPKREDDNGKPRAASRAPAARQPATPDDDDLDIPEDDQIPF
jgi:single-strand DNA-binding protein